MSIYSFKTRLFLTFHFLIVYLQVIPSPHVTEMSPLPENTLIGMCNPLLDIQTTVEKVSFWFL